MAYTFNLSDKISNFGTVAMFIIPGLQAIFNAQFVAKYVVYHWAEFRESGSNGSFVIAIKPKTEKKNPWVSMLLVHILQKKKILPDFHEIRSIIAHKIRAQYYVRRVTRQLRGWQVREAVATDCRKLARCDIQVASTIPSFMKICRSRG